MSIRLRSGAAIAITLGAVFATSGALAAWDAVLNDDTELHASAKSSSKVVDTVDEGDEVTITKCQGNWCYVKHPGPDGWVRKSYLEPADYGDGNDANDCQFSLGPNGFKITCNGNSVQVGGQQQEPPDLPYGPDTCKQGYVWRAINPADHVCVTGASRSQAAKENAEAGLHVDPNGQYGPNSCKMGFVWREAYQGDVVCVTGARRDEVAQENAEGPSHRVQP